MRWILFQRVGDTEWTPVYGPLSELAHGAVIYALLLGLPGYLVYVSRRQICWGKTEYKRVLWWAILMWPLMLLSSSTHMHVLGSRDFCLAWALTGLLGLPWIVFGVWRVVPLLLRRDTGVEQPPEEI